MTTPSPRSWWSVIPRLTLCTLVAVGCSNDLPDYSTPPPLAIGESREIELRYVRFDVTNFEQTFTRQDLLDLPRDVRERLWLLDLDISGGEAAPMLLDNALASIRTLDPATLTPAARNMQRLLNMTPDNADLSGTSFEPVISLSPVIGVSSQMVLADMLNINVEDTFLSTDAIAATILTNIISSHPNAQYRRGPVSASNPDGMYPVRPGSLPVTLADAASDFATLSRRFGETYVDGVYHPGFIVGDVKGVVFEDDFEMTVRANANALPYKGVDMSNASSASVNSTASQILDLFDFADPNWLRIQGLRAGAPTIESLTFKIVEHPGFVRGGKSPQPAPYGESSVWALPAWTIERVLVDAALSNFGTLMSSLRYDLPGEGRAALELSVDHGWTVIKTAGGLGTPPVPQYVWDILLEVGQVRLHDGGIEEGDADVEFTLTDIPVGVDSTDIEAMIRRNIEADPTALLDVASGLLDNTRGAADFYYYRPRTSDPAEDGGDYLYFVTPEDIGQDENGAPVRPYAYQHVGFFADSRLAVKLSSTAMIDGDSTHEKIRIQPGMTLFAADDENAVFRIDVGEKPGQRTVHLTITRVK